MTLPPCPHPRLNRVNTKINKIKGKMPSVINLATAAAFNAKINDVKNKIPDTTNLATTTALAAVENKVPNVSNLFKKLIINQKLVKLKIKLLLIMTMINVFLLQNLIS